MAFVNDSKFELITRLVLDSSLQEQEDSGVDFADAQCGVSRDCSYQKGALVRDQDI